MHIALLNFLVMGLGMMTDAYITEKLIFKIRNIYIVALI